MLMVRFSGLTDVVRMPYYYLYEYHRVLDLEDSGFFETWLGWLVVLSAVDLSYSQNVIKPRVSQDSRIS